MPDPINHDRRRLLGAAAMTAAGARLGILGPAMRHFTTTTASVENELVSLANATAWINSTPLTASGLRGKVVLIDFWTYTCINWLRTLPYVRAWHEKYKDRGLVAIGVHAPEFPFEHDLANVCRAAKVMRVNIRSRSTTTLLSGARSATSIGPRSTSSMRRVAFAISTSARATTSSRNE